jgi:hypothetical protein
MLLNRYMARQKTTMIAPERYRRFLWNKSLAGGAAYNERTDGRLLRFDDFWDVIEPVPVPGADRQLCEAGLAALSSPCSAPCIYRTPRQAGAPRP